MKKIKLNTAKLQLNKEKISELSNVEHLKVDEMKQINGGTGGFSFLCLTSLVGGTLRLTSACGGGTSWN